MAKVLSQSRYDATRPAGTGPFKVASITEQAVWGLRITCSTCSSYKELPLGAAAARCWPGSKYLVRYWQDTKDLMLVMVAVYALSLHTTATRALHVQLHLEVLGNTVRSVYDDGVVLRQKLNSSAALSGRHLKMIDTLGLLADYEQHKFLLPDLMLSSFTG